MKSQINYLRVCEFLIKKFHSTIKCFLEIECKNLILSDQNNLDFGNSSIEYRTNN